VIKTDGATGRRSDTAIFCRVAAFLFFKKEKMMAQILHETIMRVSADKLFKALTEEDG
jgi:hypothetical protein